MSDETPELPTSGPADPSPAVPPEAAPEPDHEPPPSERLPGQTVPYQASPKASPWGLLFFAGLVALLAGVFWWVVERESTVVLKVWLFLSAVATLAPVAWHLVDVVGGTSKRRIAAFGYVLVTVVLGLLIATFAGLLNTKFAAKLPSWDLTRGNRYTLDEESKKLLARIDGTIYATYLVHGGQTDDGLRQEAISQLRVFEDAHPRFDFESVEAFRDPEHRRRRLERQGVRTTSSGEEQDVIVLSYAEPGREVAQGKQKELKVDVYTWTKRSSVGTTKWLGERLIANAVMDLVFQKYKVYATGGHGERTLTGDLRGLREALHSQNIDVETEPLALSQSARIPDDCDVLLVADPKSPFAPEEAELVEQWVEKGRTLFVTLDVRPERQATGLEGLLERFGITPRVNYVVIAPVVRPGMGFAVLEMTPQFTVQGSAYADHPAVAALREGAGFGTKFLEASYLEVDERAPEGLKVEPVVWAPSVTGIEQKPFAAKFEASRRNYQQPIEGTDKLGRLPILVTSIRSLAKTAAGDAPRDARVIVSGDTDVFTDRAVQASPQNLDLAIGLVQWGLRRADLVAVSERTIETQVVTTTEYMERVAFFWPLAVTLLPLIFGSAIWWARRR